MSSSISLKELQYRIFAISITEPKAVAYLWRGSNVYIQSAFNPSCPFHVVVLHCGILQCPNLGCSSCQDSDNPKIKICHVIPNHRCSFVECYNDDYTLSNSIAGPVFKKLHIVIVTHINEYRLA